MLRSDLQKDVQMTVLHPAQEIGTRVLSVQFRPDDVQLELAGSLLQQGL